MGGDVYVRGMLTLIAVCMLVVLAGQFGLLSAPEPMEEAQPELVGGRFVVTAVRTGRGPALLRTDTATGEVSRIDLQAGTGWLALEEGSDEESAEQESPAEAEPTAPSPPAEQSPATPPAAENPGP